MVKIDDELYRELDEVFRFEPEIGPKEHTITVGTRVSQETFEKIEKMRGSIPRSDFLRCAINFVLG